MSDGNRPDAGGQADGWSDAGADGSAFTTGVVDPAAQGELPIAIAVSGARVGVAYFADLGEDAGVELRYVEPGSAPETVTTVERHSAATGVALALDGQGVPHIGYLGGASDDQSPYWQQSDFAVATRGAQGWTSEVLVRTSGEAASGVQTSDFGTVVGLSAVLVDTPTGLFGAYRDIHGGQFETDYEHSDIEMIEGRPGAWSAPKIAVLGGNSTQGHGGAMVGALSDAGPALAWSARPSSATDVPREVWFARRSGQSWSEPAQIAVPGDTGVGPSLAWSSRVGFALVFEDRASGVLSYLQSTDGVSWSTAEPLYGAGTGGWYPSVAFGAEGEPAVAYYVCSSVPKAAACRAADDALVFKQRRAGRWPTIGETVDADGATWPRLAFANGKAVIAYKDRAATSLRLAVQK